MHSFVVKMIFAERVLSLPSPSIATYRKERNHFENCKMADEYRLRHINHSGTDESSEAGYVPYFNHID